MDQSSFEARLKAEGYPEIRTNEMPAHCHNAEHSHPFDALALVLEGEITLSVEGSARTYRAGEQPRRGQREVAAALARAGGDAPFRLQGRIIAVEAQAV